MFRFAKRLLMAWCLFMLALAIAGFALMANAQSTIVIYPASWISTERTNCQLTTIPAPYRTREVLSCGSGDMAQLDANIRRELDPFFTPRGKAITIEYAYLDPLDGSISYEQPASSGI